MAHAGGRPTKYHEGMPELLVEAMKRGDSVTQFCADQDISKSTFYEWVREHQEFSHSFDRAAEKCEAYWESWLKNNMGNKNANGVLVKMFFTNRFGWSDKKEQNVSVTMQEEIPRAIRQTEDSLK
jgi:hypothetical protein